MKSSFHSLIIFLPFFCNCQFNSVPLLPRSYPGRLASRNSTQFFSTKLFFITTLHGPRRKHSLYCWEGMFAAPLHNDGSYWSIVCVFLATGMCLLSLCLAMNVYSDLAIPAFGRRVTICLGYLSLYTSTFSTTIPSVNYYAKYFRFYATRITWLISYQTSRELLCRLTGDFVLFGQGQDLYPRWGIVGNYCHDTFPFARLSNGWTSRLLLPITGKQLSIRVVVADHWYIVNPKSLSTGNFSVGKYELKPHKCVSMIFWLRLVSRWKLCGPRVAQLVEALCYKPESRGFHSRWGNWNY
jgi:hypothetical protein